jgi:CDP-paratose 2-epimerase
MAEAHALLGSDESDLRGQVFNVGGGYENTISLLELCDRWGIIPEFAPWRPADQRVFYCDIRKAKERFNWKPSVLLDDGLDDLFAWTEQSLSRSYTTCVPDVKPETHVTGRIR